MTSTTARRTARDRADAPTDLSTASTDGGAVGRRFPRSDSAVARRRRQLALIVLALPCVVYAMDLTVLHLTVPSLSAGLRPTSTELLWIVDIYGFVTAGC